MGEIRKVNVDLDAKDVGLIDRLLAEERFSDEAEVIRYALMLLQDWSDEQDEGCRVFAENYSREEIRQLWEDGLASGPSLDGNFDLDDIRERGLAKLAELREAQARAA